MPERELVRLLDGGGYFECPRWHDGRWWVSDFYERVVLAIEPSGRAERIVAVEHQPSGLGWMPDGSLLVGSMKDRRVLRRAADGALSVHADVSEYCGGHLNDIVVDSSGRAYAGNFGYDLMAGEDPRPAVLVRIDPEGSTSVVADDLRFPNGAVITPDGSTLIVDETGGARITAFTIRADGTLTDRRVWAQLGPTPPLGTVEEMLAALEYAPDGCTLDAEGHLWAADALGGRCCRIAPGGELVEAIRPPDNLGVFACMLGGEDGRTLLLTTAPDFLEHNRAPVREAMLFTTTVDVPHAGLP